MAESNLIGQTILGYKVEERLGSGAFGTVYRVSKHNAAGHYTRALKHITIPTAKQYSAVLNSMGGDHSKADDYFSKALQEIVNEIKVLNSLSEKGATNIVRYYENEIVESSSPKRYDIYILMEYLTPFSDYINESELTVNDVINLGLDILSALKACHRNGIIHRDIKDDNIFVTDEKEFKLGDFGVSKVLKDRSKAESMKGTPNYIAPEVYLGREGYTTSVDLYSLGIVMYKLLNYSRNPFLPAFPDAYNTDDEDRAFEERMKGSLPPFPTNGGEALGLVVVKAISDKGSRYQTAEEFIAELSIVRGQLSSTILQQKVNIVNNSAAPNVDASSSSPVFDATVGEKYNDTLDTQKKDSPVNDELHKKLFETVKEQPVPQPSIPYTQPQEPFNQTGPFYPQPTRAPGNPRVKPDNEEMLRKKKKTLLMTGLIYGILLMVYHLVIFEIFTIRSIVFWISYSFMMLAFLLQFTSMYLVYRKTTDIDTAFYGIPLASLSIYYWTAELFISVILMIFQKAGPTIAITLQAILVAAFSIVAIIALMARDVVQEVNDRVRVNVASLRSVGKEIEMLVIQCSDPELKSILRKLSETIKYSDPISNDAVADVEQRIFGKISETKFYIGNSQFDNARKACTELDQLFKERNSTLLISK